MGARDKLEKQCLRNNDRFADAFNYFIYKGRQVVDPKKLKEIDSTEIVVPYGKNVERKSGRSVKNGLERAKAPTQRFRDEIKTWEVLQAMADDKKIYVILGAEAQDKVHYAAPVKDGLYDFMNYARQVTEAAASYKKDDNKLANDGGEADDVPSEENGVEAEVEIETESDAGGRIKVTSDCGACEHAVKFETGD